MQRAHCGEDRIRQTSQNRILLLVILASRFEAIHRRGGIARRLDDLELRADTAGELTPKHGLSEEIADTQSHPLGSRVQIVACRDHYDRNLGGFGTVTECLDDLKSVHLGHHQIEQDHIDLVFMYQLEALWSGVGLNRDEAFTLQIAGEDCDGVLIVVNHHYLRQPGRFIHTNPLLV